MLATYAALVCLLIAGDVPEVPLVGRPADLPFSGASAGFAVVEPGPEYRAPFAVTTTAEPTEVEELAPVTFTVTVRAAGKVQHPPTGIDLRELLAFSRRFHIEDVTDGKKIQLAPSSWRWVYRLRPRASGIDAVPGLPFVFYNPDLKPAEKGFQVIWTDPIPLRVRSAERLTRPVKAPASALEIVTGTQVLRVRPVWSGPGVGLLILSLAAPPLACLGWYLHWRRRYPDAARLAHERRSWAARRALRQLDVARRQRGRRGAEAVVAALGEYLRERFDFPVCEPTPDEVADWLVNRGVGVESAERARRLVEACAAERFQPEHDPAIDLLGEGRDWILSMEEVQCPSSS